MNKYFYCLLVSVGLFVLNGCSDVSDNVSVRFTDVERSSVVSIEGLSAQEPWGQWSHDDTVIIKLKKSLPESFHIDLKMNPSFGPVVGQQVNILSGGVTKSFTATDKPQVVKVEFSGVPAATNDLIIKIPGPKSPKELGFSNDERRLGLALVELTITPTKQK